jgi:integrase
MARASRSSKLETRTSRVKLKANHEPYWIGIGLGLYLGYRKGVKGGSWIARYYVDGKYRKQKLGKSDDYQNANNIDVLDYFQAQAKARKFANQTAHQSANISLEPITVAKVVQDYLNWFKTNRKSFVRTKHIAETHIIPQLGHYKLDKLSTIAIRQWLENLAKQPPRLRSTKIKQNYKKISDDQEAARKRKASANRILTVLKAALNHAWRDGLIDRDEAWRKVKPFGKVNAPKIQYLELSECERLINACEPDFRQLVRGALLTGCRYGELTQTKIQDYNVRNGTLHVIVTKNGKPRHIPLTEEGKQFFEQITAGKTGDNLIFVRSDGEAWGKSHQSRRLKDACKVAKIEPVINFHVLRHTYGSLLASKGVSLQVIAELLGHADTRITSRHYAHLMPSYVSETLKQNLPTFVKNEKVKVTRIDKIAAQGDIFNG